MTRQGAAPFAKLGAMESLSIVLGFDTAATSLFSDFSCRARSSSHNASAFATGVQGAVPPPTG